MPIPTPNAGENEDDFISRCMSNPTMLSEYPDSKRRAGICYTQWREKTAASITYEAETEQIRENRKTAKAQAPHDFKPAQWTHKNGHPRCIVCGSEEPISGRCEGVEVTKARKRKLSREYMEETLTMLRQFVPPWLYKRVHRMALPRAGGRAAQRRRAELRTGEIIKTELPFRTMPAWLYLAKKTERLADIVVEPYYKGRQTMLVKEGDKVIAPEPFVEALSKVEGDFELRATILDVPAEYGPVAAVYDVVSVAGRSITDQRLAIRRLARRRILNQLPRPLFRPVPFKLVKSSKELALAARDLFINPDVTDGIILRADDGTSLYVEQAESYQIQTVIFPKSKWSLGEARDWLREHDFRVPGVDETENSYRFRQAEPGNFERIRPVCLTPQGAKPNLNECRILAMGGPTKAASVEKEDVSIITKQDELQQVTGIVMEPEKVDAHGDAADAEDIRKAAHQFAMDYRLGKTKLRVQHERDLADDAAVLIENYIAPHDMQIGGQLVRRGSWVQTWQITIKALWQKIKRGLITGFSIGGLARKVPV